MLSTIPWRKTSLLLLALFLSLGSDDEDDGCKSEYEMCADMCKPAGVKRHVSVNKAYTICACKDGESKVTATAGSRRIEGEDPPDDKKKTLITKSDAVSAIEELEKAMKELTHE